jgi:DNA-binding transcriptional LysR family regulator
MSYLNNLRIFVRVVELESLSAAGRDQRVSPAVASNSMKELEKHLGVRLFNRTTRKLFPTEHGKIFYEGVVKILEAVASAEAAVADLSQTPRGAVRITAPLGIGRRFIAPGVPEFHALYPGTEIRLRLSDHKIDLMGEAADVSIELGVIADSNFRMRGIMDCPRVVCASPKYIERRGAPKTPAALTGENHSCLLLRYTGSQEFFWMLNTPDGIKKFEVKGSFDTDDGDVLTQWAIEGHGIINKPKFEVMEHLRSGALVSILEDFPPVQVQLAAIYPHKNFQDPKVKLLIEFMAERCQRMIKAIMA